MSSDETLKGLSSSKNLENIEKVVDAVGVLERKVKDLSSALDAATKSAERAGKGNEDTLNKAVKLIEKLNEKMGEYEKKLDEVNRENDVLNQRLEQNTKEIDTLNKNSNSAYMKLLEIMTLTGLGIPQIIRGGINVLRTAFPELFTFFSNLTTNLWVRMSTGSLILKESISNLFSNIGKFGAAMWDKIGYGVVAFRTAVSGAFSHLGSFITNLGPFISKFATSMWDKIGYGVVAFRTAVSGAFAHLGGLLTKFGPLLGKLTLAGGAFLGGWEIGTALRKQFPVIDEYTQKFFGLFTAEKLEKVALREANNAYMDEMRKAKDGMRSLGDGAGWTNKNMRDLSILFSQHKDMYEKLTPAQKKVVEHYTMGNDAAKKNSIATNEVINSIGGLSGKMTICAAGMVPFVNGFKDSEEQQKKGAVATKNAATAIGDMAENALKKAVGSTNELTLAADKNVNTLDKNKKSTDDLKTSVAGQATELGKVSTTMDGATGSIDNFAIKQDEVNRKINEMNSSMGILTKGGIKDLNQESDLLVSQFEKNKGAYAGNEVAIGQLKDRIQEQLDKYKGYDEVPEKLKNLANEYGVLSSAEEEKKKRLDELNASMGILTKKGLEEMQSKTKELTTQIIANSASFEGNAAKSALVKEKIKEQLDAYIKLGEKAPAELQALADKYKVVDSATLSFAQSLGYLSKDDVSAEINKMTSSLDLMKGQLEANPALITPILEKMQQMRDQAAQAKVELPASFTEQENSLKAMNTTYEETKKKLDADKKAKEESTKATEDAKKAYDSLSGSNKLLLGVLGISAEKFKKLADSAGKIGGALTDVSTVGKDVVGLLGETTKMSDFTKEHLGGLLDGVGQVGAGFTEFAKNPISGSIKIVGGAIKAFSSLFKLFGGDKVGKQLKAERQLVEISKETEKKIRELEKSLKSTSAATSMLMHEIIKNANVTDKNFDNYAKRTHLILKDFEKGKLSLSQTQEAMGKAFNELIEDAQRLGKEGTKEMVSMIKDVRAKGMEVAEITDYVNGKLDEGAKALETYLGTFGNTTEINKEIAELNKSLADGTLNADEAAKAQAKLAEKQAELSTATQDVSANWDFMQTMAMSTFRAMEAQGKSFMEIVGVMGPQLNSIAAQAEANGLQINEGLQAMTNMSTFVQDNEQLAKRIEATKTMMEALGDSAFMTKNDFSSFATQTVSQFDDIMKKTTDQEMALRLIAPNLNDLIKYSESYGFKIDDNTQKLINQAKEEGFIHEKQKSDQKITNELLLSIADAFGARIPEGLRKMAGAAGEAMTSMQGSTQSWQSSLGDVENRLNTNLPNAINYLDGKYSTAMTGNTIVAETQAWTNSLTEVEGKMVNDLPAGLTVMHDATVGTMISVTEGVAPLKDSINSITGQITTGIPEGMAVFSEAFTNNMAVAGEGALGLTTSMTSISDNLSTALPEKMGVFTETFTTAMTGAQTDALNVTGKLTDMALGFNKELPDGISVFSQMFKQSVDDSGVNVGVFKENLTSLKEKMDVSLVEGSATMKEKLIDALTGAKTESGNLFASLASVHTSMNETLPFGAENMHTLVTEKILGIKGKSDELDGGLKGIKNLMEKDMVGGSDEMKRSLIASLESANGQALTVSGSLNGIANIAKTEIAAAMTSMQSTAVGSMQNIQSETGNWNRSLDSIKYRLTTELPKAVRELDDSYKNAVSGNTIIKENDKWEGSLKGIKKLISKDLTESAEGMDKKYAHVTGNLQDYLDKTSKEGFKARLSFEEMRKELNVLENAKKGLEQKQDRNEWETNVMQDYKRQIVEISEALKDSIPKVDSYTDRFKNLKTELKTGVKIDKTGLELSKLPVEKKIDAMQPEFKAITKLVVDQATDSFTASFFKSGKFDKNELAKYQQTLLSTKALGAPEEKNIAAIIQRLGKLRMDDKYSLGDARTSVQQLTEVLASEKLLESSGLKKLSHLSEQLIQLSVKAEDNAAKQIKEKLTPLPVIGKKTTPLPEKVLPGIIKEISDPLQKEMKARLAQLERDKKLCMQENEIKVKKLEDNARKFSEEQTLKMQLSTIQKMKPVETKGEKRGDIVFEHITVQSENGEEAVKEFMTAIKGNKYGVQNLIRKVAN